MHSTSLSIECVHSMTFYILYNIYNEAVQACNVSKDLAILVFGVWNMIGLGDIMQLLIFRICTNRSNVFWNHMIRVLTGELSQYQMQLISRAALETHIFRNRSHAEYHFGPWGVLFRWSAQICMLIERFHTDCSLSCGWLDVQRPRSPVPLIWREDLTQAGSWRAHLGLLKVFFQEGRNHGLFQCNRHRCGWQWPINDHG